MCIVNADADDMRPIAVHAGESPDEHGIGDLHARVSQYILEAAAREQL